MPTDKLKARILYKQIDRLLDYGFNASDLGVLFDSLMIPFAQIDKRKMILGLSELSALEEILSYGFHKHKENVLKQKFMTEDGQTIY